MSLGASFADYPKRIALSRVVGQIRTLETLKAGAMALSSSEGPGNDYRRIRTLLVEHLGSEAAADAWLRSTDTGYPGSALDAVRSGKAHLVLQDLEDQWGPSPSYA